MIIDYIMNMIDVEMEIEDLANFMFQKNVNNVPLELSMSGIENNKDMYYFCLDLFCKGLIQLFSKDGKSVTIEELTYDDFQLVKSKMSCAGIHVSLEVIASSNEREKTNYLTNLHEIDKDDNNKPLHDYKFILNTIPCQYVVSFSLFHNV